MAKARIIDHSTETPGQKHVQFFCPGCQHLHHVPYLPYENEDPGHWYFNEDLQNPTIKPSILYHETTGSPRCHCVIHEGRISFGSDTGHWLKGETVPLEELPA